MMGELHTCLGCGRTQAAEDLPLTPLQQEFYTEPDRSVHTIVAKTRLSLCDVCIKKLPKIPENAWYHFFTQELRKIK